MTIKHKVLKDFQLLTPDKKIVVLKAGSIIEEYKLVTKSDTLEIERDIIDNNPEFFLTVDWKAELISHMKQHKLPQPSVIAKKIIPFIEEVFIIGAEKSSPDDYDYKQKVKALNERESILDKEYRVKLRSISEKESEYESKLQKIERREKDSEVEYEQLLKKESDLRSKLFEFNEKESQFRDLEFELGKKERNMDKLIIDSEKNIDEKQKEMNDRLEEKLKDLDKRENDYNINLDQLSTQQQDIDLRENQLKLNNFDKIRNAERMLIEFHQSVPWGENFCPLEHCDGGVRTGYINVSSINDTSLKLKLEEIIREVKGL